MSKSRNRKMSQNRKRSIMQAIIFAVAFIIVAWCVLNYLPRLFVRSDNEDTIVSNSSEQKSNEESTIEHVNAISNGNLTINLQDGVSVSKEEEEKLFAYIDTLISDANKRLSEIERSEMEISKYDLSYDGTTVTIRLNSEFDKYVVKHSVNEEEKEYMLEYLARIIDLEAGYGEVSDMNEKLLVGIVFLIRVDTQGQTFDGVYWDENQYGSSYRFDWETDPSDEAMEAAKIAYEQYKNGSFNVPEWLWCQGMNIWGDIYQISFQYPEIEGQSPQYFTEG